MSLTPLPVGFRRFHRQPFLDYQLNRLHALGWADPEDLHQVARRIRHFSDAVTELTALSARAKADGRLRNAASYLRGAEFFTPDTSSDKRPTYERYRAMFARATAEVPLVLHEVPYGTGALPVYRLPAPVGPAHGTVLVHGGFDSLIEEFFPVWERIAAAGFDVLAFEGPGQGGARVVHGLRFDHDWEKPVAAVLDHFRVDEASLVGISMGGYWALRAAAYEPRIVRVVSWSPVYDWLFQLPPALRSFVRWMVKFRGPMDQMIRVRMRLFPVLDHAVRQAMALCGGERPMDAVDWLLGMNHVHLGSERVTADVLLLAGERDAFQPPKLMEYQRRALTHARSVRTRTFTAAEHADQHCQMGNLALAVDVVTEWLASGTVVSSAA